MAASPIITSSTQTEIAAATRYTGLAMTAVRVDSNGETIRDIKWYQAGTLSNLFVRISANASAVACSVTVRKNAVDGNLTVSIAGLATGTFEDTTHTDSISSGDLMDFKVITGTGGTMTVEVIRVIFEPTTAADTVTKLANGWDLFANATSFIHSAGSIAFTTNTTGTKVTLRGSYTWKSLSVDIGTNSRTTTTTVASEKNSSVVNQAVSISAGATGLFEDTTHTDSLVAGDTFDIKYTYGAGTENLVTSSVSSELISSDRTVPLIASFDTGRTHNFNTTAYYAIAGDLQSATTEDNKKVTLGMVAKASDLSILVSANSIATSASTMKLRVNGADSALSVSIAAGATGTFTDSSDTVSVVASDALNISITTPNTSGSLTIRNTLLKLTLGLTKNVNETEQIIEATNRVEAMVRNVNETEQISEAKNEAMSVIRNVAEVLQISEAKNTAIGFVRNVGEAMHIGEAINKVTGLVKNVAESVSISEAKNTANGFVRNINEVVNVSEALNKLGGVVKNISEILNVSEVKNSVNGFVKNINESVHVSEAVNRTMAVVRTLTEALNISEARNSSMVIVRSIGEALNISEVKNTARSLVKTVGESVNVSELTSKVSGVIRVINESITIGEAKGVVFNLVRVINESIAVSEASNMIYGVIRNIGETLHIVELINSKVSIKIFPYADGKIVVNAFDKLKTTIFKNDKQQTTK